MLQLILCTCPDKISAQKIAQALITKKLAACVNMIPNITSIYEWEGKVVEETEVLLLIKTKQNLFTQLSDEITHIHPYDIPEVIALDIAQGNPDYMHWLNQLTIR